MPFITTKRRDEIEAIGPIACVDEGDPCYIFYKYLVDKWKKEPRWKTVHQLYRDLINDRKTNVFYNTIHRELLECEFGTLDVDTALELAWAMFFRNFVLDYEDKKEKENGSI